jgi:hypothetical protein
MSQGIKVIKRKNFENKEVRRTSAEKERSSQNLNFVMQLAMQQSTEKISPRVSPSPCPSKLGLLVSFPPQTEIQTPIDCNINSFFFQTLKEM